MGIGGSLRGALFASSVSGPFGRGALGDFAGLEGTLGGRLGLACGAGLEYAEGTLGLEARLAGASCSLASDSRLGGGSGGRLAESEMAGGSLRW